MGRRISRARSALVSGVERSILLVRGEKVILDFVLGVMFGVTTKALLQAVRRNPGRFPNDFMYQLSAQEVRHLRSQFVTSKLKNGTCPTTHWLFRLSPQSLNSGFLY